MTTLVTIDGREIRGWVYSDLALATQRATGGRKPMRVILGEDERYWVATPADANRLERAGYEYAC